MKNNLNTGLLILRITLGVLFLLHGIAKLKNGVSGMEAMFQSKGLPGAFAYLVYLGEIIAPLMLIFGFRVKLAALLFIATMLVAILIVHSDDIFALNEKSGASAIETPLLYLFGALALFFTGGGRYSLSTKNRWD